jgi:hypothetical protein
MATGHRRAAAVLAVTLTAVATTASAAQAQSFTITKQTQPDGDPTAFNFTWEGVKQSDGSPLGSGEFQLSDGQSVTVEVDGPGFFTVQEQSKDGWKVADIVCDNGNDTDPTDFREPDVANARTEIELSPGENKSCTFTNEKLPQPVTPPAITPPAAPPAVTPPAPPAPPTPPQVQVLPRQVRSSAARLVGPSRCVSRTYSVAVSGSPVRSVSFWVNGKRIKTVRARTGQRRFRFTRALRTPVARVEARVNFASNASPATRRLRKTIRRCAPAAVRPQFTG